MEFMENNFFENNRLLWDQWTVVNLAEQSDYQEQLAQLSQGNTTLPETILKEVGEVAGKSLLHLMCHIGLDTLSWARLGAKVTGVDFFPKAIHAAQSLNKEFSVQADFICADIYRLEETLTQKFDIVFTSIGVLVWLPDLHKWAQVIAHFLKQGGIFYIYDGHPLRQFLLPGREDALGKLVQVGYFGQSEPECFHEQGSYANPTASSIHTACYWPHAIGEIVTALCETGLQIQFLHEFPKLIETGQVLVRSSSGQYEIQPVKNMLIPNLFSIRAVQGSGGRIP
jgi:SAM-dependent methyltransferase